VRKNEGDLGGLVSEMTRLRLAIEGLNANRGEWVFDVDRDGKTGLITTIREQRWLAAEYGQILEETYFKDGEIDVQERAA